MAELIREQIPRAIDELANNKEKLEKVRAFITNTYKSKPEEGFARTKEYCRMAYDILGKHVDSLFHHTMTAVDQQFAIAEKTEAELTELIASLKARQAEVARADPSIALHPNAPFIQPRTAPESVDRPQFAALPFTMTDVDVASLGRTMNLPDEEIPDLDEIPDLPPDLDAPMLSDPPSLEMPSLEPPPLLDPPPLL
ncbi:hypothetical protein J8273_4292 [Carpediemonas membranifera]|uniref:Uncharacterized protein n=1 Tax=Carpediemonas membranifera TaxID=201153 RepID=A0A8J6AWE2_9EUKA|nr:hypothetical protein J8273_4292 [Carpediemonas membranifera]|eukprot:KAG9394190.1 hypothetical protein J8273_4292 [Carpediemonas membranifera]